MAASQLSVDVILRACRHSKLQRDASTKSRAYSWLFLPRSCDPASRISAGNGRRHRAVLRSRQRQCGQDIVQAQLAGGWQPVGHDYPSAHTAAAQLPAASTLQSATSKALAHSMLFGSIKSSSSWVDCQRLLHANAEQLDAMLLSTLVTQTVYVHQNPSQEQQDAADGGYRTANTADIASGHQQHQQQKALSIHSPITSRPTGKRTRHSSKSNRGNSKVAFGNYLHQLAQVSLLLIMNFRPQQFSNVLWGLAKCGYAPSGGFIDRYLSQAELQLVNFHPRNLAQLIWALATMQAKPSRTFLANFLAETSDKLPLFKPQDIANTLWALATLGIQPPMDWLLTALSAAESQWDRFKPQELSITIWGFARLGMTWRTQPASPGLSLGGSGLSPEGLGQLLMAVQGVMPSMSPQEVCNLLWGLAVGRADLAPQQVQFLAMHALRVLYQNQLNSSSGGGSICRDLCSCMWSLTKLRWTPSTQQAELPIRLLHQQQHLWNFHPGSSSSREAATLLWCFGKLRIRPPAETMQLLLLQVQQGIASPSATAADAVQALSGCRALQWRPSRAWWAGFHQESLGVVRDASVVEVSRVLAYAAGVKPLQPTKEWWEALWRKVGRSAYATLAAYGLKPRVSLAGSGTLHRTFDRHSVKHSSSVGTSGGTCDSVHPAPTAIGEADTHTRSCRRRRGISSSTSHTTQVDALQQQEQLQQRAESWDLTAVLASSGGPWHEIHQVMQQLTRLRATAAAAAAAVQNGAASGPGQTLGLTRFDYLNPQSTMMLLWSCARLRRLPFKGVLWQLLFLVLMQLHNYTPEQLAGVMWSASMLFERYNMHMTHCRKVLKLLVVGAQWRLHTGMAGEGVVQKHYVSALRFLACELGLQRLLRLKYRSQKVPKAAMA